MKYHAALPERNSNVSDKSPLKEFLILLTGLLFTIILIYSLLGLIIDYVVDSISDESELAIFQMIKSDHIDELLGASNPSEKLTSSQALLDELLVCTDIPYPIDLNISKSETINAFALPGGKIIVHSGLLDNIKSENGLAYVLAHELAHFKNRDHLRSMGRGIILLSLSLLVTGAESDLSQILGPTLSLEVAQFSQSRENLADAKALEILNCHYGHVGGATELFEIITEPKAFDFSLTHYFASHPQALDRINAINALAKASGYSIKAVQ